MFIFLEKLKLQADRKAIKRHYQMHCASCGKSLGTTFLKSPKNDNTRYCSQTCYDQHIFEPKLIHKPDPSISSLIAPDKKFLIGKSSGGMYFEAGRCVYCGHPLSETEPDFQFCSQSCRSNAIRPYLPSDFNSTLDDDYDYKKAKETLDDLHRMGQDHYEEENIEQETGKSYVSYHFQSGLNR